jgi:hypothetical protein
VVASGSNDKTVRLWDGATGALLCAPLEGHSDWVSSVALCAGQGGRLVVASGGCDMTVRLWDCASGAVLSAPLAGHSDVVTSLALCVGSAGRLVVASGSDDRTVRLWDGATGEALCAPLQGHGDLVLSVSLCEGPDGGMVVASGSFDNTVRLWDGATGAALGSPLKGHRDRVFGVSLCSGKGGRLVLASGSCCWASALGCLPNRSPCCTTVAGRRGATAEGPAREREAPCLYQHHKPQQRSRPWVVHRRVRPVGACRPNRMTCVRGADNGQGRLHGSVHSHATCIPAGLIHTHVTAGLGG